MSVERGRKRYAVWRLALLHLAHCKRPGKGRRRLRITVKEKASKP